MYKQYINSNIRFVDDTFIQFKYTNRQAEVMINNLYTIKNSIYT